MRRLDELDSPLNSSQELREYVKRVKDLCRDLYMELEYGAEILQKNLGTLPTATGGHGLIGAVSSRVRARQVAASIRRGAEAQKYCGGQAVKAWTMFVRQYAPEIEAASGKSKRPAFKVDG